MYNFEIKTFLALSLPVVLLAVSLRITFSHIPKVENADAAWGKRCNTCPYLNHTSYFEFKVFLTFSFIKECIEVNDYEFWMECEENANRWLDVDPCIVLLTKFECTWGLHMLQ